MSASAARPPARRAEEEYTAGAVGDRGNFCGWKAARGFIFFAFCPMCSVEAQTLKLKDEMKQKLGEEGEEG